MIDHTTTEKKGVKCKFKQKIEKKIKQKDSTQTTVNINKQIHK